MKKTDLEDLVSASLEEMTFEDLLVQFDLSPHDVMWILYNQGQLDDEILETIKEC